MRNSKKLNFEAFLFLISLFSINSTQASGKISTSEFYANRAHFEQAKPLNEQSIVLAQASCRVCGARSRSCHRLCGRGPGTRACHQSCSGQLNACKRRCSGGIAVNNVTSNRTSRGSANNVSFQGKNLEYNVKVLKIPARFSKPKGSGPFPAIVVLPHCCGMQANVTTFWPNYLKKLGYATLVVDTLRAHKRSRCSKNFVRLEQPSLTQDAYGALSYLAKRQDIDKERIGVIGFSLGGITINYFANDNHKTSNGLKFKAAASLYAHCYALSTGPNMVPLTVINGALEHWNDRCRASPKSTLFQFHELKNAYHAYDNKHMRRMRKDIAGNKMLYNARATKRAQEIVKAFFEKHL